MVVAQSLSCVMCEVGRGWGLLCHTFEQGWSTRSNVMAVSSSTGNGSKRLLVFVSAVFGWGCCFLCQRTLPSAIGHMTSATATDYSHSGAQNHPVFTKNQYGRLQNLFVAAYSVSILFSGFLSDYFNPRILFYLSMTMSGLLCAVFPLTTDNMTLCSTVWILFGVFEGCGWPATAKMVKQMYTPAELGMWWSFLSSCSNLAASISPVFVSLIFQHSNWWTAFYVTGSIPLLSFPLIALMIGTNSAAILEQQHKTNNLRSSAQAQYKWHRVFVISSLWLIIIVYIILWVAKSSTNNWALLYLEEVCQQCKLLQQYNSTHNIISCTYHNNNRTACHCLSSTSKGFGSVCDAVWWRSWKTYRRKSVNLANTKGHNEGMHYHEHQ